MKIDRVEAIHLRLPEVREVADGTQDVLLVRLHAEDGTTGLGEVVSCSYVARAVVESPRSAPFRHGLAAIITGMEINDAAGIDAAMIEGTAWYGPGGIARHAMSGVDMALWDLRGKIAGVPVRRLLRADAADRVPAYASVLWPDTPEQLGPSASISPTFTIVVKGCCHSHLIFLGCLISVLPLILHLIQGPTAKARLDQID